MKSPEMSVIKSPERSVIKSPERSVVKSTDVSVVKSSDVSVLDILRWTQYYGLLWNSHNLLGTSNHGYALLQCRRSKDDINITF